MPVLDNMQRQCVAWYARPASTHGAHAELARHACSSAVHRQQGTDTCTSGCLIACALAPHQQPLAWATRPYKTHRVATTLHPTHPSLSLSLSRDHTVLHVAVGTTRVRAVRALRAGLRCLSAAAACNRVSRRVYVQPHLLGPKARACVYLVRCGAGSNIQA
jgi:hypothetical protein